MLRPQVAYILLIFAALGVAQSGYKQQFTWQFILIIIILSSWYINATTINDLADYKIDQINLKGVSDRPLANNKVDRKKIIRLNFLSAVIAIIFSFLLDIRIGFLVAFCLILNYAYSLPPTKVSYRGALAPLLLPIGYVLLPFLVGVWSINSTLTKNGWYILVALYISFIGRIILKDFRDIKGDKKYGKRTFLIRYGRKSTCIVSALCISIGNFIILDIIPHNIYIIYIFELILLCILYGLYKLYKVKNKDNEKIIINSIVRIAGGVVIMLLAILTLHNNNSSLSHQIIINSLLGIFFIAMFWDSMNKTHKFTMK